MKNLTFVVLAGIFVGGSIEAATSSSVISTISPTTPDTDLSLQFIVDFETCPLRITTVTARLTGSGGDPGLFEVTNIDFIHPCTELYDTNISTDPWGFPNGTMDFNILPSGISAINDALFDLECCPCEVLEFRANVIRNDTFATVTNWTFCVSLTNLCCPCIESIDFADLTPCSTDTTTFTVTVGFGESVAEDTDVPLEFSVDNGLINGSSSITTIATVTPYNSSVTVGPFTYDPDGTSAGTVINLTVGDDPNYVPDIYANVTRRLLCPCPFAFELQDCSSANCGTCNTTVTIVNKTP